MALFELILLLIILVISAIPLNIAVKLLGGDSSIMKVIFTNLLVGLAYILLHFWIGVFAGIASFIAMLLIYKVIFNIGWIKAFFAWILQGVIIIIFILALTVVGVTLLL